jgi:AbrB family looped-hinge helix DNA binding protein
MTSTTLTSKGQATIPKAIRQLLGIKAGGKIAFEVREREVVLRSAQNPAGMLSAYGKVRHPRGVAQSVGTYLGAHDEKTRAR